MPGFRRSSTKWLRSVSRKHRGVENARIETVSRWNDRKLVAIPPKQLLRAQLLQMLCSVRSERLLRGTLKVD